LEELFAKTEVRIAEETSTFRREIANLSAVVDEEAALSSS
jgi:hypothetical protein